MNKKLERERKTIKVMIGMYCSKHHNKKTKECKECSEDVKRLSSRLSDKQRVKLLDIVNSFKTSYKKELKQVYNYLKWH